MIKWFEDGHQNVSANCIDRLMLTRADQSVIIWETGHLNTSPKHIIDRAFLEKTGCLANVLNVHGETKGDRMVPYMPMIPEAAYAMLACTRIGAIRSIVLGGAVGRMLDVNSVMGRSRNLAAG